MFLTPHIKKIYIMKKILLLILSFTFLMFSCQDSEFLSENDNVNVASRAVKENIQYSAKNGILTWKCGILSGQVGSEIGSMAIEMELNAPKIFYATNYYDRFSGQAIKDPVVEDVGGIDVHTIEYGVGYAVLYSFVSGEDLVNVWLEGQEYEDSFQIPCYVFDMDSYSLALNESETTLTVSPVSKSRSIKLISSIEIMTYDKEGVFTQTYAEGVNNAGINIVSLTKGKYVVKIKDESGAICYQRLVIG